MKKITLGIALSLLMLPMFLFAQNKGSFYANMSAADALAFKVLYPDKIEILESSQFQSAVLLTEEGAHLVHENVITHGPGYVFRPSEIQAREFLVAPAKRNGALDYSITEDVLVNECLDLVDGANIIADILDLQNYGTRYHTKPQAEQAVLGQKSKWDAMIAASGRTDIHTRIYDHVSTPMPSVILTIDGANSPDEFVIIGGHIDSTSWDKNDAPGADDNASGIASLNEMVRVLLAKEFVPNRTIEVMAYAAEEIGLVGSGEIARNYANNNVNVVAYVQFDMTGYKGSSSDIYITTDYYNSSDLNGYLVDLMNHYNSAGDHGFTYNYTECGYGCSDHASWAAEGYDTSFPFEAEMGEDNPNIHTPGDVYSFFNTASHAVKFTKLGLEFLIETAKPQTLGTSDFKGDEIGIFIKEKVLSYQLREAYSNVREIAIYNIEGKKIFSENLDNQYGNIQLLQFAQGFYIIQFQLENGDVLTKKFVLN